MAKYLRSQVAILQVDNKDYPIYEGVNTIGRNKDAVVNIKNINVSQNHAILVVIDNKHYLSDIGSSNLTYHNGVKLIPFLTSQLSNDSKIKFGNVNGVYCISNAPVERTNNSQLELTQDMTQGFYNADTQIFQNITNLETTQREDLNADIHEAATQEMTLNEFKLPGKPAPRKSNEIQSQSFDIHDAPTQVFDIALCNKQSDDDKDSTSKFSSLEKEDDQLTQPLSLNTTEKIAELCAQSKNVHEECTQVVDLKEHTEKEDDVQMTQPLSLNTTEKIAELCAQSKNVHEECTQVVDLKEHTESFKKSPDKLNPQENKKTNNIWEQPTQVANLREPLSTQDFQDSEMSNLDIHENYMDDSMEIQRNAFGMNNGQEIIIYDKVNKPVNLEDKENTVNQENARLNVHEMATQKVDFLGDKGIQNTGEDLCIDKTEAHQTNVDAPDINQFETLNKDTTDPINTDTDLEVRNITQIDPTDSQATNVSTTPDLDTDNDETDCEDNLNTSKNEKFVTNDENSNESFDFLAANNSPQTVKDNISDKVTELSPLYEGRSQISNALSDANSDTDDEIVAQRKIKTMKLSESQERHADSDSDSEIGRPNKKRVRPLEDSQETDVDDNSYAIKSIDPTQQTKSRKDSLTKPLRVCQSQKIAEDSFVLEDADSDNDMLQISKQKLSFVNTTIPETQVSFNDSDYIPATQNVSLKSTKKQDLNNDKTESFKLVLSQSEKSEKFHDSQIPCCSKDLSQNDNEDFHNVENNKAEHSIDTFIKKSNSQRKVDRLTDATVRESTNSIYESKKIDCSHKCENEGERKSSESMDTLFLSQNSQRNSPQVEKSNIDNESTQDDIYLAATQKVTQSIQNMDETGDSFYIQATQRLPENENIKTTKMNETDDGFYLQATQQLADNIKETSDDATQKLYDEATQKLSPIVEEIQTDDKFSEVSKEYPSEKDRFKKFAFKKRTINLDASLNTCLKPNSPKSSDATKNVVNKEILEEVNSDEINNHREGIQIKSSIEIPLETQVEIVQDTVTRPTNPISLILENQPTELSSLENKKNTGDELKRKKGFNANVDQFKGVLIDKKPCVSGTKLLHEDLTAIEKLESQNQEMVEELLQSDMEVKRKTKDLNTEIKNKPVGRRTSQRRISASNSSNAISEGAKNADEASSKVSERLAAVEVMDVPTIESNRGTNLKSDEVLYSDTESTKDESNDNTKTNKNRRPFKPSIKRRRTSIASNKSKSSGLSDTSDGEEVGNKKGSKSKESLEESEVASRRSGRPRKIKSSIAENLLKEEDRDKQIIPQPGKKRTSKRKILSDEDINTGPLLKPVAEDCNESNNKTLNSTLNQTTNQSINCTMNQSLAFLEATRTTTRKTNKKTLVVEDLKLKAPARRSMNLVCGKEETSDIETHVKLAAVNDTIEKKTKGRGRTSKAAKNLSEEEEKIVEHSTRRGKVKETVENKVASASDRKRKEESNIAKASTSNETKMEESTSEKPDVTSTSRGRRTTTKRPVKSSSNTSDSGSVSGDSVLSTPKKQRLQRNDVALLSSVERNLRRQKPKVVFTMLESPKLESFIRQLGGSIVQSVEPCTVLVTEHVKRSQKLLTAVGLGKPICSPSWIEESKKSHEFLDPWDHILIDKDAEAKWQFSLRESLQRSSARKILQDYIFQIMVSTATDVLKGAIDACGGKCVTKLPPNIPNVYVIASSEHKSKYQRILKQNFKVKAIEPEAIFDGVLRQELRFEKHYLT